MAVREDAQEFVGMAMSDGFDTCGIELCVAELRQAQRAWPKRESSAWPAEARSSSGTIVRANVSPRPSQLCARGTVSSRDQGVQRDGDVHRRTLPDGQRRALPAMALRGPVPERRAVGVQGQHVRGAGREVQAATGLPPRLAGERALGQHQHRKRRVCDPERPGDAVE